MADKRQVRKSIKDLQRIKTWQLLVLLILVGFISATLLRLNNIGMVERREAVLSADEEGNEEKIIQRLYDLQHYVSGHMNTDLGKGVPLNASFQRDYQEALTAASGDQNPNGNIYKKAQEICAPRFSGFSTAYLQCTTSELAKYPAATGPATAVAFPSSEAYVHSFASPVWSPDFAGWSLVVCALITLMIIVRLISLGVLKLMLRQHYRRV